MYSAKKTGRKNFKTYSAGLNEHACGLLRLEVQLKLALESHGFALFYQPIIDIKSGKLVGTEIGLGRTLNLKVVGKGIESEESMENLRDFGCDQAQGYLFSEPVPAHEFESWCRTH